MGMGYIMDNQADARPTKRFFIENLTRDLSLEDAILDLIDNSIDALVRSQGLDIGPSILTRPSGTATHSGEPLVSLAIDTTRFEISDRCGGIDRQLAIDKVFRFGRLYGGSDSTLGVYGIGLKRAIFKLGRMVVVESKTLDTGFKVTIDVAKWAEDDNLWSFPMEDQSPAATASEAGTTITVTDLNDETVMRIANGSLLRRLETAIATTYTLFLTHFLSVSLNTIAIQPRALPIASSDALLPLFRKLEFDGVAVELIAGCAVREGGEWNGEQAGWYVLCNGRVVLAADKSDATGWGQPGPQYVSKFRGFIGIAFFFSSDPAKLPWTTTKRDLNEEAIVYQRARSEMSIIGRPVLSFLSRMYPSEPAPVVAERKLADSLHIVEVSAIASREESATTPRFAPSTGRRVKKTTIRVQYDAERAEIERIKNHIGHPDWGAGAIGKYTFDRFVKAELSE